MREGSCACEREVYVAKDRLKERNTGEKQVSYFEAKSVNPYRLRYTDETKCFQIIKVDRSTN